MGIKKTLGLGIASAALGLSLIGGGTFAYFSDTAQSTATFAAGTLDLNTNPSEIVSLSNLKPGDIAVRSFTLQNSGTLDIKELKLDSAYTVTDAGTDNGARDLGEHFKVKLLSDSYVSGDITNFVTGEISLKDLKDTANYDLISTGALPGGIAAGQSKVFKVAFVFVDNGQDQNVFQGDALALTWTFNAKQGLGELK
ncbi:TasA family protein [Paenibacillus sp. S150]|uniref:TasA family protein n=1 Tax=Paenibacillus sp. S150 TaxID=2749826 RepID=UPI001C586B35|nr:TasA family protein [Paenibacillus sp. S150]MBW4085489.1 cell division protein FtsN [Paenibacillus sp. S150]